MVEVLCRLRSKVTRLHRCCRLWLSQHTCGDLVLPHRGRVADFNFMLVRTLVRMLVRTFCCMLLCLLGCAYVGHVARMVVCSCLFACMVCIVSYTVVGAIVRMLACVVGSACALRLFTSR